MVNWKNVKQGDSLYYNDKSGDYIKCVVHHNFPNEIEVEVIEVGLRGGYFYIDPEDLDFNEPDGFITEEEYNLVSK